jgi:hypothetical protein
MLVSRSNLAAILSCLSIMTILNQLSSLNACACRLWVETNEASAHEIFTLFLRPREKVVGRLVLFQILFGVCGWLRYPALSHRSENTRGFTGDAYASQTLQSALNP